MFHRLQGKHVNRWITTGIVATWEVRGRYGGGMVEVCAGYLNYRLLQQQQSYLTRITQAGIIGYK